MVTKKISIKDSLRELEIIAGWFEAQKELDVEEGLKRVRDGVALIKELKGRIKKVENDFKEIKKDIEN